MQSVFFTLEIVCVWLSALFNHTGLGETYHTNEITLLVMFLCTLAALLRDRRKTVPPDLFFAFSGTAAIFTGSALYHGYGLSGLQYLSCFLLIYLFSRLRVRERGMYLSGLVCLGLGAAILLIFNYGTQLSGWNSNSVAMIGLFSYILFVAACYNLGSRWAKFMILLAGGGMIWLTAQTDSRSCMVMLVIVMALAVLMRRSLRLLRSRRWLLLLLLIPLIVAAATALLSLTGAFAQLDAWSQANFDKPIFNGREVLWRSGFAQMAQHLLFGSGKISELNWHNTAVACLTNFGVLGYLFWLGVLYALLKRGSAWLPDPVVAGCMMAFLLMNAQQSVELGMFEQQPNLLIYLPLGLMLGRIRYLKGARR